MKYLYSYILLLTATANCFSQAPDIEWQNTIGGVEADDLRKVFPTSDGGFILGGSSVSGISGDKSSANFGPTNTTDYWIVKTDHNGIIQWEHSYGGNDFDIFKDLSETIDGGFIIAGYSQSDISGNKTENSNGEDFWIIKINSTGDIEWQKTIGNSTSEELSSIQQTADGGYIAGGTRIGFTPYYNYYVVRLDSFGDLIWERTIGGSDQDILNSVIQTSEGGFLIGGYSFSGISGYKTEANLGGPDYWIIKLDEDGNIVWQNTIGGDWNDFLQSMEQTSDGGYILGGTSGSSLSGDKSEEPVGGTNDFDYWIVKLNNSGNIEWQNTIGGSEEEELHSIHQTSDNGYIIAGYSKSGISGDKTEINRGPAGTNDYWVIKLDSAGNIIWQKTIGGNSYDDCYGAYECPDNGFITAGSSGSAISGEKTETNSGVTDYWAVKLFPEGCHAPAGIVTDDITSNSVKVHWNAVSGATKYQINYRPVGGGAWQKKNSLTTAKNLPGLIPNTIYQYKIKTICGADASPFSSLFNFTTLPFRQEDHNNLTTGKQILIYPNPAADEIKIFVNTLITPQSSLIITDLAGKIIYQNEFIAEETLINVSDFAAGIYFVQVYINGEFNSEKLIKQ